MGIDLCLGSFLYQAIHEKQIGRRGMPYRSHGKSCEQNQLRVMYKFVCAGVCYHSHNSKLVLI